MLRFWGIFAIALVLVVPSNGVRTVAEENTSEDDPILVRFSKGQDVFSPQEVIALEILPRSPKIFDGKLSHLTVSLHRTSESVGIVRPPFKKFPDDSTRLALIEQEVFLPKAPQEAQWIPVPLVMPTTEGVCEIGISFSREVETSPAPGFSRLIHPGQRPPQKAIVQSVISCVVANPTPIQRPVGKLQIAVDTEQPETVDTANPAYRREALDALEAVRESGALLEVNTGGIGCGYLATPYPDRFILEAWREMGGGVIVGSDCHAAGTIDAGFDAAAALIRAAGFRSVYRLGRGDALFEELDNLIFL